MNPCVVGEKCWTAFYRETKDERDQKVFSSWSTCTTGGAGSEGSGVIVVRVVVSQVICVSCLFQSDTDAQDAVVRPYSEHCSSVNMELWLTAACGYKGPVMVRTDTTPHHS